MRRPALAIVMHLFLKEVAFSRNRNFHAFDDPRFREALVVTRRLRGLLHDLERLAAHEGTLTVEETFHGGRPATRLELRAPRERRTSYLPADEWDVFMAHPKAAALVAALRTASAVAS
jgi:hypothetical protein